MRGAFGKPQGTVARVRIGQPIMSVRSSDRYKAQVIEALRRAKFKYPGRQKVSFKKSFKRKLFSNFILFAFRSSCPRNGASQNTIVKISRDCVTKAVSYLMASVFNSYPIMVH